MTRGRIIWAIVIAVVAGIALRTAFGVETAFAVAWGLLAGLIVIASTVVVAADPRDDAPDIPVGPERRGTAISRMAWSLNPRTGQAGELIRRRVRAVLAHRLERHGLDIDDPAHRARIDDLIGPRTWDSLTASGTTADDIVRALDAADRLAPPKEKQ